MANSKQSLKQCTNVSQGTDSFNCAPSPLFIPVFTEAPSPFKQ